jgi:hypothetical protein
VMPSAKTAIEMPRNSLPKRDVVLMLLYSRFAVHAGEAAKPCAFVLARGQAGKTITTRCWFPAPYPPVMVSKVD